MEENKKIQDPLTTEKLVEIAKSNTEEVFRNEFGNSNVSTEIVVPENIRELYEKTLGNLKEYSTYFPVGKQKTPYALRYLNAYKQCVNDLRVAVEERNDTKVSEAIATDWEGWNNPDQFILNASSIEIISACLLNKTSITTVLSTAIKASHTGIVNIDKLHIQMERAKDSNIKKLLSDAIEKTVKDAAESHNIDSASVVKMLAGGLGCDTKSDDIMSEINKALIDAIKASMVKKETKRLESYSSSSTKDDGLSGWEIAGIAIALLGAVGIGIWAYSKFREGDVTIVSSFDTGGHMNAVGGFFG